MKKNIACVLLLLSLTACHVHMSVNEKDYYPFGETRFLLNQYFSAWTDMNRFNGVVIVKQGDKILLHEAYNMPAFDVDSLEVEKSSQFDIRSVSKLMAKALVYEMQAQGKLSISDPMTQYLPGQSFKDSRVADITIEHLMHNQSGFPRELSQSIDLSTLSPEQILAKIAEEQLEFDPGTDSRYSNLGFQLLYHVLGKVSGSSFEASLNAVFFEPLQMNHSGSHFYAKRGNLDQYAYGHEIDDDALEKVRLINDEIFKPGKIYATAGDMMLFLNDVSNSPYMAELMSKETGKVNHAGGTDGKRAYVELDSINGYQFVFLTNFDDIEFAQIIRDVQAILENKPYQVPAPIERLAQAVTPTKLKLYTGTYVFHEINNLILEIKLENDQLAVYQEGEKNDVLQAESETVFFTDKTSRESFTFIPHGNQFKIIMDWRGAPWMGEKVSTEE